MKIYLKTVFQMTDAVGEYVPVFEESFDYDGPIAKACFGGASSAEKSISNSQQQMMTSLQGDYATQFKGQTAILKQLSDSASPIFAAGPNQFGFSKPEETALRTQADEGTAASYEKAKQATGEQLSGIGGGNTFLPSGTEAGIDANIAVQGAADQANKQLGITEAGYEQGRTNYNQAASILGGVAAQDNPLGYSGAATGAGSAAFGSASQINQQNNQGAQILGGLVGGGLSALSGGFGNLDTTGGSSSGEQTLNFLGGL